MSQLGSVDSGHKLQRQKRGPGYLGERKQRYTPEKEGRGMQEREGVEREGERESWVSCYKGFYLFTKGGWI